MEVHYVIWKKSLSVFEPQFSYVKWVVWFQTEMPSRF